MAMKFIIQQILQLIKYVMVQVKIKTVLVNGVMNLVQLCIQDFMVSTQDVILVSWKPPNNNNKRKPSNSKN